jgi:hypothetical protein
MALARAMVGNACDCALMGVISLAGRERDKLRRIKLRPSPIQCGNDEAMTRVAAVAAESSPSEAMLKLVRALARAAAIADYDQQHRLPDAMSDNESGDLRKV